MENSFLKGLKVLVAEDNSINQMIVKHTLQKVGAHADIVGDGGEAVEKLSTGDYDVVLMDIQMPVKNGYEATEHIRKQLRKQVPIIAMTAFALNGEEEKCRETGMNGYVSKPFTIESLGTAIRQAINETPKVVSNPHILTQGDVSVDLSMLYDIASHDEAYIRTMVLTFLENLPITLAKIEAGLQAQDWDAVYHSAHFAKSSLSVIRITNMHEWMLSMEVSAKRKINLENIPSILQQAKDRFLIAGQMLADKFQTLAPSY